MRPGYLCLGVALIGLCGVTRVDAQTPGADRARESERLLPDGRPDSVDNARSAFVHGLVGKDDVTYAQVLEHPDDPALNAAWARTQIARGDLLGASATLERILLRHPESVEARLVYGFVLYRLDDAVTAQMVLAGIDPSRLTPAQREEREQVLKLLEQRRKRLRQSLTLAMGSHHDSNRNASPGNEIILIRELPFRLEGGARRQGDWGVTAHSVYEADYDLGTDPRMSVFGMLNLMGDRQAREDQYNTETGGVAVGMRYSGGPWNGQASVFWNGMTLQSDYYLGDWGAAGHVGYHLIPTLELFADLRLARQAFHDVPADPSGSGYSGTAPAGWFGAAWRSADDNTISLALGLSRRDASDEPLSNDRHALRLSDTYLLGGGQFLTAAVEWGVTIYDRANPVFSDVTRRDRDQRYTVTYGVPVGTAGTAVGVELPDGLSDVVVSVSGEYYRANSTLPNYTYGNVRTQVLASKRWEF